MIGARTTGQLNNVRLVTGGSGYAARPTVTVNGGGGTGASLVAHMAGTVVESVKIVNAGTGYTSDPVVTFSGTGGAEAVATAYTGALQPASFVRSRFNNIFVFDGMGRGLRWDGKAASMQPVGLQKPAVGPTVSASSATGGKYVARVEVAEGGTGYFEAPVVTISGGGATKDASVIANIADGSVASFEVRDGGAGYSSQPTLSISGGNGQGATLAVVANGSVSGITVTSGGTGYTSPSVVVSSSNGLTGFSANAIASGGVITGISITAAGTGATTTPDIQVAGGTGASLSVRVRYGVAAVSVVDGGSGFETTPTIEFKPSPDDLTATAAAATATVSGGAIQSVTVVAQGAYSTPPTAVAAGEKAEGRVILSDTIKGKYKCAIRYIDDTTRDLRGPLPSSISELKTVNADSGASAIKWALSHPALDDRVAAVELWRGTADQEVVLFKVATIARDAPEFSGEYIDTVNDDDLTDPEREGYAMMPVVLPSGQVNARRFEPPPGHFAVAVSFQDRVWFAVDATGRSPNSLRFSEIDEPESVPPTNELVLQESSPDSDAIVALAPLNSSLLVIQSRHLYKLQYVSQPVIDASILLGAYRGILNPRCWDVLNGVAYIADSYGLYAYDGDRSEPASVPVDNFWTDGIIDLAKSDKFFVKCDHATKTVRFFYCQSGDDDPVRCLCYCAATKAWWTEDFAVSLLSGGSYQDGAKAMAIYGGSSGAIYSPTGGSDDGTPINYSVRTGNFPLSRDGSRGIGLLYTPTESDADLQLKLYYNGADTHRENAITRDPGGGFIANSDGASINMNLAKNTLQDSNGFARAMYSGRLDERSSGADRHLAVELSGQRASTGDKAEIHAVAVEGAG